MLWTGFDSGGNSEYLYLHEFLRLTVADSRELISYIFEIEKAEQEKDEIISKQQIKKNEQIQEAKRENEVLTFVGSIPANTPIDISQIKNYIALSIKGIKEVLENIAQSVSPSTMNQIIASRLQTGNTAVGPKFFLDGNIHCLYGKGKTTPEITVSSAYISKELDSSLVKRIAGKLTLTHSVLLMVGNKEYELDTYALFDAKLFLVPKYHYTCYFNKTKRGVGILQQTVSSEDFKPDLIFGDLSEGEIRTIRATLMQRLNAEEYKKGIYKWGVVGYDQKGQITDPMSKHVTKTTHRHTCLNLSWKSSVFYADSEYVPVYNN